MTRVTHLTVTHGTNCHPSHPHLNLPIKHAWHAFPDYLKEDQTTLINISSGRLTQYIRMINICHLDTMVRIIDWSKQVSHVITTVCHGPRSTTCRVKGQDEVTTSHFPRSFHMITYHDLCQTARRVMMALPSPSVIMTTQNISSPLKKNQSFWYYIYQPSHKEEGKLAIPSKKPTDYLSLTMADKTIGGCVRTPCPDIFCR